MSDLRKYGEAQTIYFPLIDFGTNDFESTPVSFSTGGGDSKVSKNGGAFANTANDPAHEGEGIYSLILSSTETNAANLVVTVVDASTAKTWEDQALIIDTYGHGSAQHEFDLDSTRVNIGSVTGTTVGSIADFKATGFSTFNAATTTVDVGKISGDSVAADNLELDYDGTGLARANSTIGTVTAVTNKVTADVTAISGDSVAADNLELDYDGTGLAKANSTIGTATAVTNQVTANITAVTGTTVASVADFKATGFSTFDAATTTVDIGKINGSAAAATLLGLVYAGGAVTFTVNTVTDSGDFTLTSVSASTANDTHNDQFLVFTSGSNTAVARSITDYTGATKRCTFTGTALKGDAPFPATVAPADAGFIIGLLRGTN